MHVEYDLVSTQFLLRIIIGIQLFGVSLTSLQHKQDKEILSLCIKQGGGGQHRKQANQFLTLAIQILTKPTLFEMTM